MIVACCNRLYLWDYSSVEIENLVEKKAYIWLTTNRGKTFYLSSCGYVYLLLALKLEFYIRMLNLPKIIFFCLNYQLIDWKALNWIFQLTFGNSLTLNKIWIICRHKNQYRIMITFIWMLNFRQCLYKISNVSFYSSISYRMFIGLLIFIST